jgi:hypothetical protein
MGTKRNSPEVMGTLHGDFREVQRISEQLSY